MVRRLILLLVMLLPLQWSALAVAQSRLHGAGQQDAALAHAVWHAAHDGQAHAGHHAHAPAIHADHHDAAPKAAKTDAGGDVDPHGCCHACAQAVTAAASLPWPALPGAAPPGAARALSLSKGRDGPFRPPRHPFA